MIGPYVALKIIVMRLVTGAPVKSVMMAVAVGHVVVILIVIVPVPEHMDTIIAMEMPRSILVLFTLIILVILNVKKIAIL